MARAIEAGVNYFDTAALDGDGASEENLGRVLAALKPDVIVSTKVRLPAERNIDERSRPRWKRRCDGSSATTSTCFSCTTRSARPPGRR